MLLKIQTVLPETIYGNEQQIVKVGQTIDDFSVTLSRGTKFVLNDVLKNGPVIINFIKGTWCPYCQLHLKNLRDWQETAVRGSNRSVTILIVSNEKIANIQDWLKNNPVPYLFASDLNGNVARIFGVILTDEEFLKPATFLIDVDKVIRMAFAGRRKKIELGEFDKQL
ncbi:MAG: peroxiredoxin family protein [Pseudobdellovibrionaceae bacterium]